MDSELRRRFLQCLGWDFAALDLREMGVRQWNGRTDWPLNGARDWAAIRSWWSSSEEGR